MTTAQEQWHTLLIFAGVLRVACVSSVDLHYNLGLTRLNRVPDGSELMSYSKIDLEQMASFGYLPDGC